jgi:hypothetical protein
MVLTGLIIIAVVLTALLVLGVGYPVEAGAHCQPQGRTWERPGTGAVTS